MEDEYFYSILFNLSYDKAWDDYEKLENEVYEVARLRYGSPLPDNVSERIKTELTSIRERGLVRNFLSMKNLIDRLCNGHNHGNCNLERIAFFIPSIFPNSIAGYCLGLSFVDPLKYDFLFDYHFRHSEDFRLTISDIYFWKELMPWIKKQPEMLIQQNEDAHASPEDGWLEINFYHDFEAKELDIICKTITNIEETMGDRIEINHIPTDEQIVINQVNNDLIRRSLNISHWAVDLSPTSFEELIAAFLFMGCSLKNQGETAGLYIERKIFQKPIDYALPCLKKILKPTFGIALYQDQIMQVANAVAEFTIDESNELKWRILTKETREVERIKNIFFERGMNRGHEIEALTNIWNQHMMRLPLHITQEKSRLATPTLQHYIYAWLKVHYPEQYARAVEWRKSI